MSLKIGVIGGGAIARACHIPGYAAVPECTLAAIADISQESLDAVREKWHFQHEYRDYREMLRREKPDLVSVCVPNKFHTDAAVAALESGADVILEKPVSTTLSGAEEIRKAVHRTGRRLAVGFSHRFNSMVRAAAEAVKAGRIGKPYMVRIRFAHNGPYPGWAVGDWFYDPEVAGGGAMLDMGIHAIDLVHWLVGPITEVAALTGTLRKPIRVEDNMVLSFRAGAGCMGCIDCSWTSPAGFIGVELYGDNVAILVDYLEGKTILNEGMTTPDGTMQIHTEELAQRGNSAWKDEMAELIAAAVSGQPLQPGIDAGIDALRVALAAYESTRSGRQIKLEEFR